MLFVLHDCSIILLLYYYILLYKHINYVTTFTIFAKHFVNIISTYSFHFRIIIYKRAEFPKTEN
jgi:hypothetical protein